MVLSDDYVPYWINHTRQRTNVAAILAAQQGQTDELPVAAGVSLLLQAVIVADEVTKQGQLVTAVAIPWFEIIELIARDPTAIHQIHWRKWEEIIAGAYRQQGFDVVLTPRSNDGGCDVIATRHGVGSIRFYDQVKAYDSDRPVTLEQVHSMIGVLTTRPNVSKAIITTTSRFAPGVLSDPGVSQLVPYRLELKDRERLIPWLFEIASNRK